MTKLSAHSRRHTRAQTCTRLRTSVEDSYITQRASRAEKNEEKERKQVITQKRCDSWLFDQLIVPGSRKNLEKYSWRPAPLKSYRILQLVFHCVKIFNRTRGTHNTNTSTGGSSPTLPTQINLRCCQKEPYYRYKNFLRTSHHSQTIITHLPLTAKRVF